MTVFLVLVTFICLGFFGLGVIIGAAWQRDEQLQAMHERHGRHQHRRRGTTNIVHISRGRTP